MSCSICKSSGHRRNKCWRATVLLIRRDCKWHEAGVFSSDHDAWTFANTVAAAWKWVGPRPDADKLIRGEKP